MNKTTPNNDNTISNKNKEMIKGNGPYKKEKVEQNSTIE